MDFPSVTATDCERSLRGRVISFASPPPAWMRDTVVAVAVSKGSPFLQAVVGDAGRVTYSIKTPRKEELLLFAMIESGKKHIGSLPALKEYVDTIMKYLGPAMVETCLLYTSDAADE